MNTNQSHNIPASKDPIIVKFMHRGLVSDIQIDLFLRFFPQKNPIWKNCKFTFDVNCKQYDWLVVYHDIPATNGHFGEEHLKCPKEKTILVTLEPITITVYGKDYLKQFGHILSFQEPWALHHHKGHIDHHPGLMWFYGESANGNLDYDTIANLPLPKKTRDLATVCSDRTGGNTLHTARVLFTRQLQKDIPEMDRFGHGIRPMADKAEALDPYKYHLTIENHIAHNHLTEKLPDAFLGYTLPFYYGAPNATDYFPKESFIPIDINDYPKALDIIKSTIANNEFEDRLPYILKARKLVLEEQNLFAILAKQIEKRDQIQETTTSNKVIRNRFALRLKNPLVGIRNLTEKIATKAYLRCTASLRHK
ncbi:MAG: glycosyltransferase family 10 [Desulfotalea sp.]